MTLHLRKMYVDCRYGQLHLHTAFPSSGGFDERTPLVCVHPGPLSGKVFHALLADLGKDRSVYAPDLPGYGESDAPESPPKVTDYAAAVGDLLDTLRLRQVDVLGYQTGSLVAAELALARPEQVRRLVLAGVPVFDAREREAYNARPWMPDLERHDKAGTTGAFNIPGDPVPYIDTLAGGNICQPRRVIKNGWIRLTAAILAG